MVLHFALLVFITSCVKVITFRVVITSCVNGITSRGNYYILRQYYILRRNSRAWSFMVVRGRAWSFVVVRGRMWSFMFVRGRAWSCAF